MLEHPQLPPHTYGASILDVPYLSPGDSIPTLGRIPASIVKAALEAKKEHPNVFWVPLRGENTYFGHGVTVHVLIRPMVRREYELYENLKAAGRPFDRSLILDDCILLPHKMGEIPYLPAGHVETAYDMIEELSSWLEPESLAMVQNYARNRTENSLSSVIDMMVTTVFKGMSRQDMRELDAYETLDLLAMAEMVLGQEVDMMPKDQEAKQGHNLDKIIRRVNTEADNKQLQKYRTAKEFLTGDEY